MFVETRFQDNTKTFGINNLKNRAATHANVENLQKNEGEAKRLVYYFVCTW
jgi:hypothetical protein